MLKSPRGNLGWTRLVMPKHVPAPQVPSAQETFWAIMRVWGLCFIKFRIPPLFKPPEKPKYVPPWVPGGPGYAVQIDVQYRQRSRAIQLRTRRICSWMYIDPKRVYIHYYYGIRPPKTIMGMVFWDLIP